MWEIWSAKFCKGSWVSSSGRFGKCPVLDPEAAGRTRLSLALGYGFRPKGSFWIQDCERGVGNRRGDLVSSLDTSREACGEGMRTKPDTHLFRDAKTSTSRMHRTVLPDANSIMHNTAIHMLFRSTSLSPVAFPRSRRFPGFPRLCDLSDGQSLKQEKERRK